MNNKISNPMTVISQTIELNDRDILTSLLLSEKKISDGLSTMLSEASNEKLYDQIFDMFNGTKETVRELYTIMFQNGWYSLECASNKNLKDKTADMENKISELD
ncbi:MAG TPA: spore coat protein [Bacilli bacterium]|nr:spore coat protein [Bacilli bacterium]